MKELRRLRDKIQPLEEELRLLRDKRDKMVVDLAKANWPERVIGANAGLSGPYVNMLKKKESERKVKA